MTEATVTGKRLALPNDILLELVGAVTPSSQVCLALTPHRFDDLIISADGEKLLGDLRPLGGGRTSPWEAYFSEQRCGKAQVDGISGHLGAAQVQIMSLRRQIHRRHAEQFIMPGLPQGGTWIPIDMKQVQRQADR